MGKLSVRVDAGVRERLEAAAQAQGAWVSDLVRQAVMAFLDGQDAGPQPPPATAVTPVPPPHDGARSLLALLPGEIRTAIQEKAARLHMTPEKLIASLIIHLTWPPGQPSPRV